MVSLEDVQKVNHLTLNEMNVAIMSLQINPNEDLEVTSRESKRIADWAEGYHEFDLPY